MQGAPDLATSIKSRDASTTLWDFCGRIPRCLYHNYLALAYVSGVPQVTHGFCGVTYARSFIQGLSPDDDTLVGTSFVPTEVSLPSRRTPRSGGLSISAACCGIADDPGEYGGGMEDIPDDIPQPHPQFEWTLTPWVAFLGPLSDLQSEGLPTVGNDAVMHLRTWGPGGA